MKICFVVPDLPILEKIQILMKNEFKRIEPYYLLYNDYKEVYKDLDKIQKNFDAVLFGGKLPYLYCAEKIKQEVMWSYVPRTGSTLVTALAYLSRQGYDLKRICFDTYSEEVLKEVYEELNIAHDFKPLLFKGDPLNDNYIDEVFDFHLRNIKSGKADIVFTHIFLVHNKILQLQLPSFFAVTTYNVLREQIEKLEQYSYIQKEEAGQVVVLFINIDYPPEYLLMQETSEHYLDEKRSIEKRIYRYADKILGFVIELSNNTYMILSTSASVKKETDNYHYISLLDTLEKYTLYTVSIGIGQADNVARARKNAIASMLSAYKHKKNSAYIRLGNGKVVGPLYAEDKVTSKQPLDDRLDKIAKHTGMSVNTVYAIYTFASSKSDGCFTSMELAENMGINKRSTDRFLRRLEDYGYIKIIGSRILGKSGRPSRIMRFYLEP